MNSNETINVSSLTLREPLFLRPDTSVLEALSVFRKSRCHLAMICEDPLRAVRLMRSDEFMAYEPKMLGIVTMEDAIEEIIQNEILDETDVLRPLSPDLASTTAHHGTGGLLNPLYQSIQLGPSRGSASSGRQ